MKSLTELWNHWGEHVEKEDIENWKETQNPCFEQAGLRKVWNKLNAACNFNARLVQKVLYLCPTIVKMLMMTELPADYVKTLKEWINPDLWVLVKKLIKTCANLEHTWKQIPLDEVDAQHKEELEQEVKYFNKKLRITTTGIIVKKTGDEDETDGHAEVKFSDNTDILKLYEVSEDEDSDEEMQTRKRRRKEMREARVEELEQPAQKRMNHEPEVRYVSEA